MTRQSCDESRLKQTAMKQSESCARVSQHLVGTVGFGST